MSKTTKQKFKRIDEVYAPIVFRRPELQPAAIIERLAWLEAAFINALRDSGCWDEDASDISIGRYTAVADNAHALTHRAKAARAKGAIHAMSGLCAVRKLRAIVDRNNPDLLTIVSCAMIVEGAAAQYNFDPVAAAASGSRREQRPDELGKHELSAALYRLAELAYRGGDLKVTSGHANFYEVVAAEAKGEVYWPKGNDGFRKQLSKWRTMGLID